MLAHRIIVPNQNRENCLLSSGLNLALTNIMVTDKGCSTLKKQMLAYHALAGIIFEHLAQVTIVTKLLLFDFTYFPLTEICKSKKKKKISS